MLFGEYLVRQKWCTPEDVERALEMQKTGDERLIGRILLDIGAISWEQLDQAIEAMKPKAG